MPDYKLKSKILSDYTNLDLFNKCNKVINKYIYSDSVSDIEYQNALNTLSYLQHTFPTEFKEYSRILHASSERVVRLKKRVRDMIYGKPCLFLTLTFTDDNLQSTTAETRRVTVRRFLKSFNVPYIANIDFGKRNGREHYHALLQIDNIDYSLWKFGAIHGLKVRNEIKVNDLGEVTEETIIRLSRYIAKLTNHAIKETTKRSAILYSRN